MEECKAHSGLITRINGLYAVLAILISLVGAQLIFQIPSMEQRILAKITETEKQDVGVLKDIAYLKKEIEDHINHK